MELELKTLFGLPAHPLIVHGAVVLVPLAALLTVLVVLVPRWRPSLAVLAAVVAVGALAAVWLASGSGDALEHQVEKSELVHEHAEMGEQMLPIVGVAAAASVGFVLLDRARRRRRTVASAVVVVVSVVALAGAVVETVQVVRTGHAGARATWEDVDEERD